MKEKAVAMTEMMKMMVMTQKNFQKTVTLKAAKVVEAVMAAAEAVEAVAAAAVEIAAAATAMAAAAAVTAKAIKGTQIVIKVETSIVVASEAVMAVMIPAEAAVMTSMTVRQTLMWEEEGMVGDHIQEGTLSTFVTAKTL